MLCIHEGLRKPTEHSVFLAFPCFTPSWKITALQEAAEGCRFSRSSWTPGAARGSWALCQALGLDLFLSGEHGIWSNFYSRLCYQVLHCGRVLFQKEVVGERRCSEIQKITEYVLLLPLDFLSGRGNGTLIQQSFAGQQLAATRNH